MQDIADMILKFFIALVCGTVVGLEREIKDKAAGLRTHIMVCIGACLAGMLGLVLKANYGNTDVLRLAQAVLIGVGFLGGGAIGRENGNITGLTTAAGIWVMGVVGLAIGLGAYYIGLLGTIFTFLTLAVFGVVEKWTKK